MPLGTLERQMRVVDGVQAALRNAIMSGELQPDTPLSVPELARRLAVSRSPVREAILQLTADGLVVERPRRGCVVARIDLEDALEIHDMRAVLESLAAERAAMAAPQGLPDALERTIADQVEAAKSGAGADFNEADRRFHALIHDAAGNRRLIKTLASLRAQMEMSLVEVSLSPKLMEQSIREHRRIVDALRTESPDRVAAEMRAHISATRDRTGERLRRRAQTGGSRS